MSRYCNKDIKVISIQVIFVTLCQLWKWFCICLKMVVKKTLKTIIQKKSPKSQKFARKYLWRSSVIVKLFFLRFTVILFHSNEQRARSNEQQAKSNEQRAKSNEQRAKSNEQRAKTNEQQVKTNEQRAKTNEQRAKSSASFLSQPF